MAQPLHFYRKKCLREDNRKDEPILDQAPDMGGGSRKGNHRPQVTLWATKEGHGLQSPPIQKSLRRSILLHRRLRDYCRGLILGYLKRS